TGMLAITLRSYLRSPRLPILFVPVYIGYERVLEGRTYLGELRGAQKKKESIFDIFKVIGALKQRFGQVWVNFGEPLRLNEFLDGEQPAGASRTWHRATARNGSATPPIASPSASPRSSTKRRRSTRSTWWRWPCCPPAVRRWTSVLWHASSISTRACCAPCPTRPIPRCRRATARR